MGAPQAGSRPASDVAIRPTTVLAPASLAPPPVPARSVATAGAAVSRTLVPAAM